MPDPNPNLSREEVQEMLPWFAAGSLSAADSHRVADWLAQHASDAELQAELDWLRLTVGQVKAEVQAQLPPANLGFESLLQKVRAEEAAAASATGTSTAETTGTTTADSRPNARPTLAKASPQASPWRALWRWLQQASPARSLGLTGLALAQAAVIVVLVQKPADDGPGPGPGQVPLSQLPSLADGALLQVTFEPTATEAQIRAALQQAQATLVSGPGAIGIYTVAVPRAAAEASAAALRQQAGVVESVSKLPAQ